MPRASSLVLKSPQPNETRLISEGGPVMPESLGEWWATLQAWWQELTPDSQDFLRGVAVLVGAFLAGQIAGRIACRRLRAHNFDAWLRPPWLPTVGAGRAEVRAFTVSGLV